MGGSVIGGDVYGQFPVLQAGSADDVTGDGVWLASISARQFGNTFSSWMGLTSDGSPTLSFLA
jgi:uncharacterized protein (DUF1501 family)